MEDALARASVVREAQRARTAAHSSQGVSAASSPRQLPLFHDELRALSNDLARSPLFSPIRPGRRKQRNETLASPAGVEIHYRGEQLDQSDADVFMQLVHLARGKCIGAENPIRVNRADLLAQTGRADGGKNYEWLGSVLTRLQHAHLKVENRRYRLETTLISKIITDKEVGTFDVVLDSDILVMFSGTDYTMVDWSKRLQIAKRVDLAKWLQSFTCSHERGLQRWFVTSLKDWSGYASPVRKFREALLEALEELERIGIITGPTLYESASKVKWQRI
ncbi:plasmid replication initiator TrfA [Scleromatobacter humisilvae]|uniref:Replication initiator protein A n=1 Tax=Scleromatobacter humisilvae TaxID=2897159 RepID=A0A9X1YLZ8_9BURK|nr:plasmid replication initiator TrfA [Scleromatobacter humisilvae]MCK9687355.1 replication initiator protein A [Scleromatobacter humisilvae]